MYTWMIGSSREERPSNLLSGRPSKNQGFLSLYFQEITLLHHGVWKNLSRLFNAWKRRVTLFCQFFIMWIPQRHMRKPSLSMNKISRKTWRRSGTGKIVSLRWPIYLAGTSGIGKSSIYLFLFSNLPCIVSLMNKHNSKCVFFICMNFYFYFFMIFWTDVIKHF